jgi:hypothetical protein
VLATLTELKLATRNVLVHLFTLCSACVSASAIVLSDSPCERIRKWVTLPVMKEDRLLVRV